jgi:glycosyltransferase involved in cell wall biosynthesis
MIIASGDLWAGAEAQIHALACALAARGDVTPSLVVFNDGELRARIQAAGIRCHCLDERTLSPWGLLRGLRREMQDVRPDVVHTHRPKEHILGALAARSLGIPSLRTVHGMPEHLPSGFAPARRLARAADTWCARRLQRAVVSVSDDLAPRLRTRFAGADVVTIVNGIDAARVNAQAAGTAEHAPLLEANAIHIGFVGRLVEVKRPHMLLALLDELEAIEPTGGPRYRLHVIGDGPLLPAFAAAADARVRAGEVVLHGFQPAPGALMRQLRALLFTSDHEGLSIAALESLALGVPVVSRPVGGMCDLVRDGADVHVPATDDVAALAQVLHAVVHRTAAPAQALPARYTIERTARDYRDLYARCAGPSP